MHTHERPLGVSVIALGCVESLLTCCVVPELSTQTTRPKARKKKSPMTTLTYLLCHWESKSDTRSNSRQCRARLGIRPTNPTSPCVPQPTCLTSGPEGKQLQQLRQNGSRGAHASTRAGPGRGG